VPASEARFPSGSRRSGRFLVVAGEIPDLYGRPSLPGYPSNPTAAAGGHAKPMSSVPYAHKPQPKASTSDLDPVDGPAQTVLIGNLERHTQASGPSPDGDKILDWAWPTWIVGGGHLASGCLQHFPRRDPTNPR
jgi:hypothetical protein